MADRMIAHMSKAHTISDNNTLACTQGAYIDVMLVVTALKAPVAHKTNKFQHDTVTQKPHARLYVHFLQWARQIAAQQVSACW